MIRVRRLVPSDIAQFQQLVNNAALPVDKVYNRLSDFMVCESDGHLVSCGCLVSIGEEGCLDWYYTEEPFRRDKLGSAVVKALLNAAELRGVKKVYASARCSHFLFSLRFEPANASQNVMKQFEELYGTVRSDLFQVSLVDYFKSCC